MTARRICITCTHSLTLVTLYKGLFAYLAGQGWTVDVVVGDREYPVTGIPGLDPERVHVIPMRRTPSLLHDFAGLMRWIWFFLRHRYDIVHVSTPKASLLAGIAARITFNGPVIFVYRRRVYELMTGWKKRFYVGIDRIIAACSRWIVPISEELSRQLVVDGIAAPSRIRLLGSGSSNGIDVDRFTLDDAAKAGGAALRAELGIPAGDPVMLFLGRICAEKGVDNLPGVLTRVRRELANAWLLVAGPDDARDPISPDTVRCFANDGRVRRTGFVSDARPYYAACDLFVFPSFFEGFGNVLLEAASMMRPAIGYDVPGVREAIEDGISGLLVPSGDELAMGEAALSLLREPALAAKLGAQGRERVETRYRREMIWNELSSLLEETAAPGAPRLVPREEAGSA